MAQLPSQLRPEGADLVIDLDQPAAPPARRAARRRPRAMLSALALLVAGAAIGGGVVYRWQQQRAVDARRSAVLLVMLPDVYQRPDDAVSPLRNQGQLPISVVLTRHVNLINAGPAPVRFVGFRIDRTGLQLLGQLLPAPNLIIQPAGSTLAVVHANVRCDTDPLTEPAPVIVDLVTADGVRRERTLTFDGRAWAEKVETACSQPWSRSLVGR